ncbi:DUF2793 domain-containing protein [Alsobacter sp. SYSU BS001988]
MTDTTRLGLPYLAAAQAQKHVTHNEALQILDGLVHCAVLERERSAPPDAPQDGDRYLLSATPAGVFQGHGGALAAFDDGAWRFLAPRAGWRVYVVSEGRLRVFDGAAWRDFDELARRLAGLESLGLGAAPDAANPFVAKINNALFTARTAAEGGTGDLRVKLNKSAPAATASHLFQSGFEGRAETGLVGDERWRLRVSADGAVWRDSIAADPATGAVSFPSGAAGLPHAFRNLVVNADFAISQRGPGPFALAAAPVFGPDRWLIQSAAGATGTLARTPFAAGQTEVPGARFFATLSIAAATAASFPELQTRMEDVAALAGRAAVVSFSYRTASAGFAADLAQAFGAGGSPTVTGLGLTPLAASPTWRRQTIRLTPPDLNGKTVGPGSFLSFRVFRSAAGAGSIDIADVQVEEGSAATPFERRPPAIETVMARRFFRRTAAAQNPADLAFEMRAAPLQSGTGPFDYSAEL